MNTVWILQTNERAFLDDCLDFEVYGVRSPDYMDLKQLKVGDLVLLRLKPRGAHQAPGYVGPYTATASKGLWAKEIETSHGIWQKLNERTAHGPRWLSRFPWCVFLSPTTEFVHDLRTSTARSTIPACKPITSPASDKLLRSLGSGPQVREARLTGVAPDQYRTTRGVWVRSRAEHMIDNWFTEHGITTHYERAIYLDGKRIVPDWYIPSIRVYVEYLGLRGDHTYEKAWSLKETAYRRNAIEYVTLEDSDLADLDRSLPNKLPQLRKMGILG